MTLLARQIWTLTFKNLLVALIRRGFTTPLRAFILPVVFVGFLSYARNLFIPPSHYGIGHATPIRSLPDALDIVSGGRNKLVFVNNGFAGGDIAKVIDQVAGTARSTGKDIQILEQETELLSVCRSTLAATSSCIAAAVFFSSPHEGPDGKWNYSIRADGALERKIVVTSDKNDVEIYALPLQHAIDFAIAGLNTTIDRAVLPDEVMEYSFTSLTVQERKDKIRVRYMTAITEILGVAFFIGMSGVEYQLTGLVAHEREIGMAQLLDCMMPNRARWQPQMVRIVANHLALDMIYLPGWVIIAIILKVGVFSKTSVGILIVFHVLSGLSLSSLSILVASLFKRAQLSGITATIVCLLLGIIAQISAKASTGAVTILCLLFPPMNYVYFTILIARWEKQDRGANIVKSAPDSPSALPGIVHWIFLVMQIFTLPLLGALIERSLYGTASRDRTITRSSESATALSLEGFTKEYRPNFFYRNIAPLFGNRKQLVMAADSLTFSAVKGQILVLLGANGSGKSTTLDAIAGLTQITSGSIHVNYAGPTGGLGLCPQKNVLWDELTVEEHVKIFNRIKSLDTIDSTAQVQSLIAACDIDSKIKARSKTLSGGQRRKLQLAMTFTGGSSMCLIDEVSSGLDPLSRRKIWDILLAERGSRTLLLTTHFLDEAELLSDSITILSKGKLRANGTAVELKHKLGAGYRVHIYNLPGASAPQYEGIPREVLFDQTVYSIQNSAQVAQFVARLESEGIHEYQVSGTTIEDVFLKVAEEVQTGPTEVIQTESTRAYDIHILCSDTLIPRSSRYQAFDIPWAPDVGKGLQLITYFGLAMSVYPAFFALYPTIERLRNVRALHYSNGVRSLPLWAAYLAFDFLIVLAASVLATIIFRAVSNVWYHLEYLFVVFFLYGMASTLLSYVISLFSRSQLAAFAFAAGGQAVMFLLYFIAYLSVLTYAPTEKMNSYVNIVHFAIAVITPVGNLTRAMFSAMNIFSLVCRDRSYANYPGEMTLYGGPILYLIVQSFFLFGLLLWWDSGPIHQFLRKRTLSEDAEDKTTAEGEVSDELIRVVSSNDGLRIIHLTKHFGKNVAVEDVTFGVPRGEVFALLGPNGAGKSTTISMIRGDIQPSRKGGHILVENVSVADHRAAARSHLGVCPQFDAMDTMTVLEHLRFYARIRGVPDVDHNVSEAIRAVGLQSYGQRMAAQLSGGNKRKLSLAIALMGNPSVLLLDEPSSGMDAASKRVMWRTLASVVPGRCLLLTTHSLEEADALANRAGILAKKMLALGTTDYLRRKYGDAYHVHLVHSQAPHTSDLDMELIRSWVIETFPLAVVELKTWSGQLRFSVPAFHPKRDELMEKSVQVHEDAIDGADETRAIERFRHQGIAALFTLLERHKEELGFEYYSVSQTTLDQVFLTIVGKHDIEEENSQTAGKGKKRDWFGRRQDL